MIERAELLSRIRLALRRSQVVILAGPRQCGKTTLARTLVPESSINYFDLEDPAHLGRLSEPRGALAPLRGLVVIDEMQRRPDLFPVLRVLADRKPLPARFLILGSASPELLRQSSESLAGRVEAIAMGGLTLNDLGADALNRHWLRGGFPRSFIARSLSDSVQWRAQFIRTFLERDAPELGVNIPSATLARFWTMVAHTHGQIWKASEPARSLGMSEPTIKRYLDAMSGLFMVRQLQPWHENLKKRQVRAPKVYLPDSGLLHSLLGVQTERELLSHPKMGASWEGYLIEETLRLTRPDQFYFWATHQGAELDLFLIKRGKRIGVEIKRTDGPRLTPSMQIALADLRLDKLLVLYPGDVRYAIADRVEAVPAGTLATSLPQNLDDALK
jgi:uncharacterized protein